MKWISRTIKGLDVEWQEEGWYFDKPEEDYNELLRCKKCGRETRVDKCKRRVATGYRGDDCGAPVFYLYCPSCRGCLAVIDQGEFEYRPLLNLQEDGEFVISH